MIKKIVFLAVLGITHVASSQYAYNSSLFYQTPALFNVASVATGAEDFSFCTAFKMQNLTMSGSPMRTNALIGEFKIADGPMSKNNFGIGFTVKNEQTGESKLMAEILAWNEDEAYGKMYNYLNSVDDSDIMND